MRSMDRKCSARECNGRCHQFHRAKRVPDHASLSPSIRLAAALLATVAKKDEDQMSDHEPISEDNRRMPGDNAGARPRRREPVFNLPGAVSAALALIFVVHAVRVLILSPRQDYFLIIETAFIPARYAFPLSQQSLAWLWSPLTYSFLHGSIAHLLVNGIWLAAFGTIVARRLGTVRWCVFWVTSSVVSAGFFLALNWDLNVPMIGASGVISALMGAAARFAFPRDRRFNRERAHFLPRLAILEAFTNRTVLSYVTIWFAINALTAIGFGNAAGGASAIAWEAHLGGFLFGFLCFSIFDRRDWT